MNFLASGQIQGGYSPPQAQATDLPWPTLPTYSHNTVYVALSHVRNSRYPLLLAIYKLLGLRECKEMLLL